MEKIKYTSSDLGLSAAILSLNHRLVSSVKEGARMQFTFEGGEEIQNDIEGWAQGTLQVSARAYFDAIKNLKGRIYN